MHAFGKNTPVSPIHKTQINTNELQMKITFLNVVQLTIIDTDFPGEENQTIKQSNRMMYTELR